MYCIIFSLYVISYSFSSILQSKCEVGKMRSKREREKSSPSNYQMICIKFVCADEGLIDCEWQLGIGPLAVGICRWLAVHVISEGHVCRTNPINQANQAKEKEV